MPQTRLTWCRQMLIPMVGALASSVGVQAAELTFDLKIEHEQVAQNMRLIRVKQLDVVRLRWGTDQPLTVHLHGYDVEKRLAPGTATAMAFTAYAAGRFPVHLHGAGGAHDETPLVVIEVYPK